MANISAIKLPDDTSYNIKAVAIPMGKLDTTSTATVMTASVDGITELVNGVCVWLTNGVITSTTNYTININNLGAKPVYSSQAAATRTTSLFNVNYTALLIYNEDRVEGGCWDYVYGYDSNTNTIGYQLRTNNTVMKTYDKSRYYRIFFTSADGTHWVPANTGTDKSATSAKTVNQRPIDPFGRIVYCSDTTNYAAEADIAASSIWQQYNLTFGYSFNRTGAALTLTAKQPIYIKCAPQSNGSAIIDSTTPYVQALPSTEDGKIYIFLGIATSATAIELRMEHPVYYYKDGAIRLWTNQVIPSVPTVATAAPLMDGTAAVGTSAKYAKEDHVHPTDTSRLAASLKGAANGVAELDSNSKIPVTQIPDSFNEVIFGLMVGTDFYECTYDPTQNKWTAIQPAVTPEAEKLYTDYSNGKVYEWNGTSWQQIRGELGETQYTAYRGDRGKTAYDHSQLTSGNPHNVSKSDVGLGNVDNVQQYSASNPPPYPVTSVNNQTGDVSLSIPTKTSDLNNDSGFITGMYIASYGSSTYAEVLAAYQAKTIVYCRASSNSDPSSGEQKRLAFLAYVNYDTTPTEFEFQYYRSVATHTDAQQGDQVFVYKLNSGSVWSVTVREAYTKVAANNGLTTSYNNGTITVSHTNSAITAQSTQAVYPIAIDAYGHITGYGSAVTIPSIPTVSSSDNGKVLTVVNGVWTASDLPIYDGAVLPMANGVEF